MKNLKLIALMMLIANMMFAQNQTEYFAPEPRDEVPTEEEETNADKRNTFVGHGTGLNSTIGNKNTFLGYKAGLNAAGANNSFFGAYAGMNSIKGGNMAFGTYALEYNELGKNNIAIGNNAARYANGGHNNITIGSSAGKENYGGNNNICLGLAAGYWTSGDNNVFIGYYAGVNESLIDANDQLYIQNSSDVETPLIYGDFADKQVGIGTSDVGIYTLAVKGHMVAEEVTIKSYTTGWADYVFAEDYDLMPLTELEKEIEKLGHLPEVPSAEEVNENGYKVGEMDVTLLKKVEELTLHLIEMDKAIKALQQSEKELNEENAALKTELSTSTEQKRTPRKKRGTKK